MPGNPCQPTVLLPQTPPQWSLGTGGAIGMRCLYDWIDEQDFTTYTALKTELRSLCTFYTQPFNAQRTGPTLSERTMDSENPRAPLPIVPTPFTCVFLSPLIGPLVDWMLCFADIVKRVLEYVGFACKYFPITDPTLMAVYANTGIMASFFSFIFARGWRAATIKTQSTAIDKVLAWPQGSAGAAAPGARR